METFNNNIIPAIAFPRHAAHGLLVYEAFLKLLACVLAALQPNARSRASLTNDDSIVSRNAEPKYFCNANPSTRRDNAMLLSYQYR
jgi:hypothetical protein